MNQQYNCSAPCRIDFSGGLTDIPQIAVDLSATHVNSAFSLRTNISISKREDSNVLVFSKTQGSQYSFSIEEVRSSRENSLLQETLKIFEVRCGINIYIDSNVPSGAGLGSSGAFLVALSGALMSYTLEDLDDQVIAEKAILAEQNLGLVAGKQDQYASVYGGLNRFDFTDQVTISPLFNTTQVLKGRIIVAHPGGTRSSSDMVKKITNHYVKNDRKTRALISQLNQFSEIIAQQILENEWDSIHETINSISSIQNDLHPEFISDKTNNLFNIIDSSTNATGRKSLGGGGENCCVLIYTPEEEREQVKRILEDFDFSILKASMTGRGIEFSQWQL